MSEWKEYKLEEIADIIGGGTPNTTIPEYWNGKISWLTPRDLTGYSKRYIANGKRSITKEGLKNSSARLMPKGTVLLSSRAPIGYIAISENEISTNQGFKSIVIDESKCLNLFIFYWLKNNIDYLKSNGTGTTFEEISGSIIKKLVINLPSPPEQRAIASVLSSLDDKIDLLHRQNFTLEQMAETLFRQWFVEDAKEDWKEGVLGDLIEVKYGKDHKKLLDGNIPVYGSGGVMRYAEKALFEGESVLIPRKGTLNNVIYINEPFWTVDTMFYTIMKKPNLAKFIYNFIKEKDLASMNVGSAVPSMTTQVLNNMPLQIPFDGDLEKFENAVTSYYQKIEANTNQIRTLEKMRDTLLPKLMSGEIKISTNE